jgi:hypothetical protein
MHLNEGEIRAYLDEALPPGERQRAAAHLAGCPACRSRKEAQEAASVLLHSRLALLDPPPGQAGLPAMAARQRLAQRLSTYPKEKDTMWNKITARMSRPAWIGLAVVALLAIALLFSPVRAIANSFLGLFRVQQVSVIPVNIDTLSGQMGSSAQLETLMADNMKFESRGEPQEAADAAAASSMTGFPVRLPSAVEGERKIDVSYGGTATFQVDLQRIQAVLKEIDRSDIGLPKQIDGATVTLDVPANVVTQFGQCKYDPQAARAAGVDPDDRTAARMTNCTTLVQMPSPTISAPPGLDVQTLGEAYLQLMGMSKEQAQQFAGTVDWTTTLVIPVPSQRATYSDVTVDGVKGTLIQELYGSRASHYVLVWVKDNIVYALEGMGNGDTALSIANSLQ